MASRRDSETNRVRSEQTTTNGRTESIVGDSGPIPPHMEATIIPLILLQLGGVAQ